METSPGPRSPAGSSPSQASPPFSRVGAGPPSGGTSTSRPLSRPASDGPEISVVIPTRNRWSLLSRTLTGALEQIDVDHEVVVVDDGSTDETPLGLTDIGDPRLRVVRHESGRGLPAARNSGISAARGRWVAFLDDDDLWSPVKLRLVLDVAGEANADFAYSAGLVVDQANQVLETWPAPDPAQVLDLLLTGNWI